MRNVNSHSLLVTRNSFLLIGLLVLIGIYFCSLMFVPVVFAAPSLSVDCPTAPSGCAKTGLDPLFATSVDGSWYPGKTVTKTINLKNSGATVQDLALQGARTSELNSLEDVLDVSIVPSEGGSVIWAGSMKQFYEKDHITMGTFDAGAELAYNFSTTMDLSAENEYQDQNTEFDMTFGFWIPPTPTPTPTTASSSSGDSGGTVLGVGVSAPVCNDSAPSGAPVLVSATARTNGVTLTWTEAGDPMTYYLVAYGTSSGSMQYGNPNIGGKGTRTYTVNNLSGGSQYFFKVRAGNGCMPGAYSNELSATPGGGYIEGPAEGFEEGVLGAETELTPMPESTTSASGTPTGAGTVAGASNKDKSYLWLILLLLIAATLGAMYFLRKKKSQIE